jgi:DNA-binding transcriptional regulator YhcF (GntR family)
MNSADIAPPFQPLESFVHQRSQKVQGAFALLQKMAYSLGPNAQMPTFKRLCEELHVSKTTLDAALTHLERDRIVCRRPGAGIFVSAQLQRSLALICAPDFSADPNNRNFWEVIIREAQLRIATSRYDLAFHFSTGESDSIPQGPSLHPGLMDDIRTRRVQGVLAVGLRPESVEWVSQQGIAVVAFAGKGPVAVNLDHLNIVELGAQALVAHGCHRIALWSEAWSGNHAGNRDEAETVRRVLDARGLDFTTTGCGLKRLKTVDAQAMNSLATGSRKSLVHHVKAGPMVCSFPTIS